MTGTPLPYARTTEPYVLTCKLERDPFTQNSFHLYSITRGGKFVAAMQDVDAALDMLNTLKRVCR